MDNDDLRMRITLVQIELSELRRVICAKEETLTALNNLLADNLKQPIAQEFAYVAEKIISEEIVEEVLLLDEPELMTDEECEIEEAIYDEYIKNQKKEDQEATWVFSHKDAVVDVEDVEDKGVVYTEDIASRIEELGIEPLSVDALSIMAIKYYKKTGEAVTDIIEERFGVKSLHKLNDSQNCVLQLILMG